MALLGLRWSELARLKVSDVDLCPIPSPESSSAPLRSAGMDVSSEKPSIGSAPSRSFRPCRSVMGEPRHRQAEGIARLPAPTAAPSRNGNWRRRAGWTAATRELGLRGLTLTISGGRSAVSLAHRRRPEDSSSAPWAMSRSRGQRGSLYLYDELDAVAAALDTSDGIRSEHSFWDRVCQNVPQPAPAGPAQALTAQPTIAAPENRP